MSLAIAYGLKRRAKMSKGGQVNPKLEASKDSPEMAKDSGELICDHGGEIEHSASCYDMGGEVEGIDGYADDEDSLTSDVEDQKAFDSVNSPDDLDNEMGDEDEMRRGKMLSRILGSISMKQKGA